jgi:glycosyltransferase involved in cell wall biosynthesis/SAM-dependent methyltransferase
MTVPFYRAFEDRHRGSRDLIKDRQKIYLPFIMPLQNLYASCSALDLGCGRGEWIELLTQQGFDAKGVDLDEGMLEACAKLDLPASKGDAVSALKALPDESVTVITGFHIAEHIPFTELQSLVSEALRVLQPAGVLILETPNAENIMVGANNFYLDPTHERPLPHMLLSFLVEHSGFARNTLLRLHEPEDFESTGNVTLLAVLGSASPDYAIVAQKNAPAEQLDSFSGPFSQHHGIAIDRLAQLYDEHVQQRFDQASTQTSIQLAQLSQDVAAQLQQLGTKIHEVELNVTKQEVMDLQHKLQDAQHRLEDSKHNLQDAHHQLQAIQQQLMDSHANAHHWYVSHEDIRRRLEEVHNSTSWKLTAPVRLTVRLIKGGVRSPLTIARRVRHAMRKQVTPPARNPGECQLFVDVSELIQRDAKTGIQRVVRSILTELLNQPTPGFEVRPVYGTSDGLGYQYVDVLQTTDGLVFDNKQNAPIHYYPGDVFLGLDLQHQVVISHAHEYAKMRTAGVKLYFVIYDLLPIFMPNSFWLGASHMHADWLSVIAQNDGAICISKAVADEYHQWLKTNRRLPRGEFNIGWFHLGADLKSSTPTRGLPENAPAVLKSIEARPTFLAVGTVEPRKGHEQLLASFSQLWQEGHDVNLVLVGKQGWNVESLIDGINQHPEFGHRLIWANSASDEYLEEIYKRSSCLVASSQGEGFGLPLIEAAQHGIPIIARDLPVFKEVAGDNALYFSGHEAGDLASVVVRWLELNQDGAIPRSSDMQWLTWEESAKQLKGTLFNGQWYWKTSKAEMDNSPSANTR